MSDRHFRLLIVDDEPNIRSGLARALAGEADQVETAKDGTEALTLFRQAPHHLVITDLKMPGPLSGLDLLRTIKHERPETLILVITAHGSVETAVEAMRQGAHDYVSKPLDLGMLRLQVRKACEHHRLREENRQLRERLTAAGEFPDMIGQSPAMHAVFNRIRQVADTDVTVLIQGESGTGKELVARALHNHSPRRDGPFIAVNIGALPETLIESELFGHEKGAFSGATRRKLGCFEMAQGGTLFLDEVGEMPPKCQIDLLRVLEQREVRRLGGEAFIALDVRVVAATHADMEALVGQGKFRPDLFYRLNVVPILVPPLRKRREDVPLLIDHFLRQAAERYQREEKQVDPAAMRALMDFSWPGNVRQLRNCMEMLVVAVPGNCISPGDLSETIRTHVPPDPRELFLTAARSQIYHQGSPPDPRSLNDVVADVERAMIVAALTFTEQNREEAARLLDISVRSLYYKMNRYKLS